MDYLIEVSTKAAEIGFMEIQFDYIRFSTGKGMSEAYFGPQPRKNQRKISLLNLQSRLMTVKTFRSLFPPMYMGRL